LYFCWGIRVSIWLFVGIFNIGFLIGLRLREVVFKIPHQRQYLPVTSHTKTTVQTNKNLPYYLTTLGLFILLKFGYTLADNDHLIFILKPTDKIVGLLTGSHSIYFSDKGYYHDSLNILIEKSCSGFNFWGLCFCMLSFLFLKYANRPIFKLSTIPFALVTAYIFTILVNASRIFVSIIVQQQANHFLPARPHLIIHEAVGVITNLTFLILIYIILEKFLTHKYQNAKLT
jgi:exosortase K